MGAVVDEDGVSLHVFLTESGEERLRFDCFDDAPHYHLLAPSEASNVVIEHDTETLGPPLDWALARLRTGLEPLLREAGASEVAARLDGDVVARVLDDVDAHARRLAALGHPVLERPVHPAPPANVATTARGDAR
jgi:hypothetical protein